MENTRSNHSGVVEIVGLKKTYGDHVAIAQADLSVQRGEIFGILGANGAGKTTTVECAQGLRRPDGGTVRVLGLDPIAERGALRGRVGSQLQESSLPERLTVGEALRLFAEDADTASRIAGEWSLESMHKSAFGSLSGGQRQRLFLALALLNDPEVVFLDELTQGLDPNARHEVWALIEQIRDRGTTVVLVTHFTEEAEELCDRIAVMRNGRVVETGTPGELIERHSVGVRMRFSLPPGGPPIDEFGALPGVVAAEHAPNGEIVLSGASSMIAYVGAALVTADAVPSEIRVAQPTLDDALLSIIGTGVAA